MSNEEKQRMKPGDPTISGANRQEGGYNFAIEASRESSVSLLIYRKNSELPTEEIPLTEEFRTGRVFSAYIRDLQLGKCQYNYKIDGKVVQDPCAYRLVGRRRFGAPPDENPHAVRCGFLAGGSYDWEGDTGLDRDFGEMILYKVHVRGYTLAAGSAVRKKGTFSGLAEKIPYWKELGINTIELMPAYEFFEVAAPSEPGMITARQKEGIVNYWGYTPGFYFAPKESYCATANPEKEFRDMVRLFHKNGIACIMEMYFAQGENPLTVLQALRFWREHYHVDGFHLVGEGVPIELVLRDGVLFGTKILAQGCDLRQICGEKGASGRTFAEYNPGFLQDMRRFLKSDEEMVPAAKYRLHRNPDGYGVVNFMAYQDGFTLYDMVSYNYKHNEANQEGNMDGCTYNYSWNCGVEGPSRRRAIRQLRMRQLRNAFAMVLLAQGTPLLYGGDEVLNTQAGNNNAYCQDNPLGWVNWKGAKSEPGLLRFVQKLIRFRMAHPILHGEGELKEADYLAKGLPDVSFHGERAWFCSSENTSRVLGILYCGAYAEKDKGKADETIYVGYNFYWESRTLALPNLPGNGKWKKVMDTWNLEGDGFYEEETETYQKSVEVSPRSIVVLIAQKQESKEEKISKKNKKAGTGAQASVAGR